VAPSGGRSRAPAGRPSPVTSATSCTTASWSSPLAAGWCVVTGPEGSSRVLEGLYRRLGADLATAGVEVVGDLHGAALDALLQGGRLRALKVSAGDLVEDGVLGEDQRNDDGAVGRVADELAGRGVGTVVVSRGGAPTLAVTPQGRFLVSGPALQPVDTAGSGDSMTAALTSSLMRGLDIEAMLARAWAAGAANVTRRGLGSATVGLIDELSGRASVVPAR
jgi:1-phosphofructokinase